MADPKLLKIINQGAEAWNKWRNKHPDIPGEHFDNIPDLSGIDLHEYNLSGADLSWVDLSKSNLSKAKLLRADLTESVLTEADLSNANLLGVLGLRSVFYRANLRQANLSLANMAEADLSEADLSEADFWSADLSYAGFRKANLVQANLSWANVSSANFEEADLTGCRIYAISAWDVHLTNTKQSNLIITEKFKPIVTVDDLEVAQFIYLLLNNQKIRRVIDIVTSKVVLILGRFTFERKQVLDALREKLRDYNFLPVMFDFDPSVKRDLTETIATLAHMSHFIIADLTDAKSLPQELQAIIPNLPSVPVQPILHLGDTEYAMFEHFKSYPWVLETYFYHDLPHLLTSIKTCIIDPAEIMANKLARRKY